MQVLMPATQPPMRNESKMPPLTAASTAATSESVPSDPKAVAAPPKSSSSDSPVVVKKEDAAAEGLELLRAASMQLPKMNSSSSVAPPAVVPSLLRPAADMIIARSKPCPPGAKMGPPVPKPTPPKKTKAPPKPAPPAKEIFPGVKITPRPPPDESDRIYVDKVEELDVLCGRGGKSNHHFGNKKYRQVVSEMKMMYRSTEARKSKTGLSRAIVDHVCEYGGRFVKKDDQSGKYYVLSKAEARKKTSQALRETKVLKWMN